MKMLLLITQLWILAHVAAGQLSDSSATTKAAAKGRSFVVEVRLPSFGVTHFKRMVAKEGLGQVIGKPRFAPAPGDSDRQFVKHVGKKLNSEATADFGLYLADRRWMEKTIGYQFANSPLVDRNKNEKFTPIVYFPNYPKYKPTRAEILKDRQRSNQIAARKHQERQLARQKALGPIPLSPQRKEELKARQRAINDAYKARAIARGRRRDRGRTPIIPFVT